MQFRLKRMARTAVAFAAIAGATAVLQFSQPAAFAQSTVTGAINGTVTDPTGAVVPNATVTIKDTSTGAVTTATSNKQGRFTANFLPPHTFTVSATAPGLQANTTTVQVLTGQQSAVNLTLSPTAAKQTVMVSANQAQLIDTQGSSLTTTFTTQQFENLPAPGGDITTIAYTLPGVVVNAGGAYGNFSSDGLPGISNLVIIDGADDNDPFLNLNNTGSSNLTIGQEDIAQAAVIQNGYSVEYGRQAGAIESYVTKSGANRVHGLLQYNYNSAGLNANYFFNNLNGTPKGKAVSNQYAAQIGGPIIHNKLFFFVDTEGLRYILPNSGYVNYPSAALQNTILHTVPGGPTGASADLYGTMFNNMKTASSYATATPVTTGGGALQDASGNLGCGDFAGTPVYGVPGGVFGTNTSCVNAAFANATNLNREWLAIGRFDWNVSDKHKLFVRITDDQGSQPTFTSYINPLWNAQSIQPSYSGQLNDTYVLSPNATNQLILSGLYYSAIFKAANQAASLAASPSLFADPFDGGTNSLTGLGQNTEGLTALGFPWYVFPQGRNVTQYQVIDEVAWLKGNHSFKFGGNLKRDDVTDIGNQFLTPTGYYYFFDETAFASGSVGAGAGGLYNQNFTTVPSAYSALYNLGVYAQDSWRVKPNLVVDYGVRVDRNGNPACTNNCFSHYVGGFPDPTATLDTPYNATISVGHRSAFPSVELGIIQPRAGFNWDTKGDGKTVVRGGVGLFADTFPSFVIGSEYGTYPYVFSPVVTSGDVTAGTSDPTGASTYAAESNAAQLAGFSSGGTFNTISASMPAGVAFSPPAYFTTPGDIKTPRYLEYNLQVQRALGPNDALILNYAGTHGYDLLMANNLLNESYGGSNYGVNGLAFDNLPTGKPDPRFAQVASDSNTAGSNYNGLFVTWKHADRHGLTIDASYAWSHSMDDISNGGTGLYFNGGNITSQITPYSASHLMYSASDYDIRNNLDGDLVYVEPNHFSNPIKDFALGGWTIASKFYWRSGQPFSVINSSAETDVANGSTTNPPVVLAQVLNNNFNHSCNSYSSPCFQTPNIFNGSGAVTAGSPANLAGVPVDVLPGQTPQTNFGNVPRNSYRGPHYADVDLSVYKAILHLTTTQFQVGVQAYNVLNHMNFDNPADTGNNNASVPSALGFLTNGVTPPTSPYGSFQGSAVVGRVVVVEGRFTF